MVASYQKYELCNHYEKKEVGMDTEIINRYLASTKHLANVLAVNIDK